MNYFLFSLTNIIVPIFIQILLGYVIKKITNFNIASLVTIQFFIITPVLLFTSIYNANLNKNVILKISMHSVILFVALYILSYSIAKIFKFKNSSKKAFTNSITLYNSGNFCIPIVQLLYKNNPFAMSIQMIIMTVQTILTNTIGIYCASSGEKSVKDGIMEVFKVPMIYAVIVAVILKEIHIGVWSPIMTAMNSIGNSMVPLALITLGAQLTEINYSFKIPKVYLSNFIRLIISPALAYILVVFLKIKGIPAEVLIISSAAPTAVNAVLLSIQYNSEYEYVSQATFLSTIISSITVPIIIFLVSGKI